MQLLLSIENGSGIPLYKRMANAISTAIQEGSLQPGQVMPSSRELAESMSVSRLTARRCYEELTSQGFIKAQSRGKTYVRRDLPIQIDLQPSDNLEKQLPKSAFAKRLTREEEAMPAAMAVSHEQSCSPRDILPATRFQECLYEAVRSLNSQDSYTGQDVFGLPELREQLQKLLSRTRGINCKKEQIIVLPSTEGGLDLICRLLLREDDTVATEDPCNQGIRRSLRIHGTRVCPVPLDSEGISFETLTKLEVAPRLVYVTPSHQDTTGITMSASRRSQLLSWVAKNESIILEDDFDNEFRYGARPQPAIFSQDQSGSVVYRTNFWNSLYPLVKMGVLVIPQNLIPLFRNALSTIQSDAPQLEQVALASFIKRGHYERYLHRSWKLYARRRASLVHALTKVFGSQIKISSQTGGTQLNARLHYSFDPDSIEKAAARTGLKLRSTRLEYADVVYPVNEYRLSFSQIDESTIEGQIMEFKQLIEQTIQDSHGHFPKEHLVEEEAATAGLKTLVSHGAGISTLQVSKEAM